MKGWHIFLHSLQQVTGNLSGAVKASALPYLIQFLVAGLLLGFGAPAFDSEAMATGDFGAAFGLSALAVMIVSVVTSLWIAVAWHRFVLLGEEAAGFIPVIRRDRIWAYFVRSLAVGLVLIAAGIGFGLIGGLVSLPLAALGSRIFALIVMAVVVYIPILIVSFRLSASLPGAALGSGADFWSGWNATKGANVDMLVLAIIAIVASLAIGALSLIPGLGVVVQFLGGWITIMVGASVLTTLYGHYIEGRNLASIREEPNPFE